MDFPFNKISSSEEETSSIADEFAEIIKPGSIITLTGDLGAGKTFFVKEVCKKLGIENSASPTFSIVNEYDGDIKVYHFDFYRIKDLEELYDIGIEEYFSDNKAVTFIEWAEKFLSVIPKNVINITISEEGNGGRRITIDFG